MSQPLRETKMPELELVARGKVRDIYDLGSAFLLVATDRLSAFDVVFDDPIPEKGRILTQVSAHWFRETASIVKNHCISVDVADFPAEAQAYKAQLEGRVMLCVKARPFTVECIVRGYLDGSAWKDYAATGKMASGHDVPSDLKQRSKLSEPMFTPSTKAEQGLHDINISNEKAANLVGREAFEFVRDKSLALYQHAHDAMLPKGIVLGDTKFEFGILDDEIILIDECMTPDSSRFWEAETYRPGPHAAFSFDKQYVRDYVESIGWEKKPPAPKLPEEVIAKTTERYQKIANLIMGK
jgi:phosphoribosylaminoimidazole-succinocarboxamide synthase